MKKNWRHRAREAALQILYQWEVGQLDQHRAADTFFTQQWPDAAAPSEAFRRFAESLVANTIEHLELIDRLIAETTEHWRPERFAVVDRLVIRMAVGELLRSEGEDKTPPVVVIDEALELARTFSTEDAVKFINGILDGVRKKIEPPPPR
jgi:N utilization substance protein B